MAFAAGRLACRERVTDRSCLPRRFALNGISALEGWRVTSLMKPYMMVVNMFKFLMYIKCVFQTVEVIPLSDKGYIFTDMLEFLT